MATLICTCHHSLETRSAVASGRSARPVGAFASRPRRRREEESLTDRELAARLVHAMRVAGFVSNVSLTAHF
jgi:hypothetical protein